MPAKRGSGKPPRHVGRGRGASRLGFAAALAAVVVFGAYVRLAGLDQRPFWRDEAWVAEAVRDLPFRHLLTQTALPAPPLFLGLAKLGGALSPPELGYRLPSALWGVLSLPVAYALVRALRVPRTAALACLLATSVSLALVIQSRDLKQYSGEAFCALLVAWLGAGVLRSRSRRAAIGWGVALLAVACLFPWLGYGSLFASAGVAMALGVCAVIRKNRTALVLGASALAGGALSAALLICGVAGQQAQNPALRAYAQRWMIDPLDPLGWLRAGYDFLGILFQAFLPLHWSRSAIAGLAGGLLVLALASIGLVRWPRAMRLYLCIWAIAPAGLLAAASAAGHYPWGQVRTSLFLTPALVLAAAFGAIVLARWAGKRLAGSSRVGVAAGIALLMAPGPLALRETSRAGSGTFHDVPGILKELERRRDGEAVLVGLENTADVRYYAGPGAGFQFLPTAAGTLPAPDIDLDDEILRRIETAGPRWWLITTRGIPGMVDRVELVVRSRGLRLTLIAEAGPTDPANVRGRTQLWLAGVD